MEFMLLFVARKDAPPSGGPEALAEMKKYSGELASQGKLRIGAPLRAESEGARIRVRGGKPLAIDGPFAESKELLGGFWVVDAASRDEAIGIARRCPHARHGIVEVRPLEFRMAATDPGKGTPFLYAFRAEPGIEDAGRTKLLEMLDFSVAMMGEGRFLETAPLAAEPLPARVETRDGKPLVTDGPFAEAKEIVAGYAVLRAANRAEAIEIAKRYPHAKWGSVEVREIPFLDPTS